MKSSKYNITVNNGTKNILYNTLSRKYVVYDAEKRDYIDNLLENLNKDRYELEEGQIIKKLIANGLVIDDKLDELDKIKFSENKAKFQDETFYLVIQPTLDCNFRCVYCYEEHKNVKMNDATIDSIVEFVKNKTKKVRSLCIAWFGGEPMMEFDSIVNLTRKFQEICKNNGCHYHSRITTNSYLFTDESINMLESLNIEAIQITLDGTKETHDKKRPLANGEGTFDQIINNLLKITDKNVIATLRINVDEENFDYIPRLYDMIPEDKRSKVRINICNLFQKKEKIDLYKLYKDSIDKGFNYFNKCNNYCKCEAFMKNSFLVDPSGKIAACSMCAENGFYYGKISDKGELMISKKSEYFKLHSLTVLDNERCKKCVELPMCMGGCTYARYNDNNYCAKTLGDGMNLEQKIKLHYYSDLVQHGIKEVNVI